MVIPGFLQQPGVPTFSHPCLKHEHEHGREPDEHEHLSSMRLPAPEQGWAFACTALHCTALRENCLLVPIRVPSLRGGGESHQTQTQTQTQTTDRRSSSQETQSSSEELVG